MSFAQKNPCTRRLYSFNVFFQSKCLALHPFCRFSREDDEGNKSLDIIITRILGRGLHQREKSLVIFLLLVTITKLQDNKQDHKIGYHNFI